METTMSTRAPRRALAPARSMLGPILTICSIGLVVLLLCWMGQRQKYAAISPVGTSGIDPRLPLALRTTVDNLRFVAPTNLRTATRVKVIEPFGFASATHSRKSLVASTRTLLMARQHTIIPLRADEGVYWVDMAFPDGVVRAVVDSGSSNLVIGSDQCKRCPTHKNGRVPHPHKDDIHVADVNISYGSQRVFTDVTMDTMRIQGFDLDSQLSEALLSNADEVARHGLRGGRPREEAVHVRAEVFMMKRVEGSTAANVFGVAPSHRSAGHPSLLSLLLPDNPRFGLMLGRDGGAMTLGPPPTAATSLRMVHVPIERPMHLNRTPTLFFMTRLHDILAGPTLESMQSVFANGVNTRPLWAMFDSGSTATYTSQYLHHPLQAAQHRAGTYTPFISLVLEGGVHFILAPSAYVWRGESTLDMDTSFVNDLLRVEGVLVGCMASRGIFMDHDAHGGRIGFAAMHEDMALPS